MRFKFLGSGDAFGSGGRLNTCFLVDRGESRFLIDCGASAMISLHRFDIDPNSIDLILISHLHGDHFGGLPFFLLHSALVARRERRLRIAGPPGLAARLEALREAMFPGSTSKESGFVIDLVEIEPGAQVVLDDGLAVTAFEVVHTSGAPSLALRIACDGKVLAYSGDTAWTDVLLEVARDADLFVTECYSYDKDVPFHLSHRTWLDKAPDIGAKRMILTHMSTSVLDCLQDVAFETAHDGFEVDLA
jgi:ribonuclease BN (tRNA processing enzyme)